MKASKDSGTFLLILLFILALVFIVVFMCAQANAMPIWGTNATSELVGSRNIGNGIVATGGWTEGFELSWNITEDPITRLWTYDYIVVISPTNEGHIKDVSYLIIEVTEGQDFSWVEAFPDVDSDSPTEFIYSYANASLYGVKFEYPDLAVGEEENGMWLYKSSITTLHTPVYGVFAAKDGKYDGIETCAWSTALGYDYRDYGSSATDFIVRPNGIAAAPEPATCFLVGIGLLGLIGMRKKRG